MGNPLTSELAYGANQVELYRYVNYFAVLCSIFCADNVTVYSELMVFIPGEICRIVKA